jgi:hypothetical protein
VRAQALRRGGVDSCMSLHRRILDMLPIILVFAAVSAFATYVIVAYIEHDPYWLQTLAQHGALPSQQAATPDPRAAPHVTARPH